MAKRIGIITIQKCRNYGADLQAYALGAKLRSLGCDAENIDYLFYKNPRHLGSDMEKPVLPVSSINRIKEMLFPVLTFVRGFKNRKRREERNRRFDAWFEEHVKVGAEYRSVASVYANPPKYDIYMVGSDQVWNPRINSNIKPYFLDFAPEGARCVSYAASLGVGELSGFVFYKYKQWLKRFSHIGLREKTGADIVDAMALDAEVAHTLDPTLLLEAGEWGKVAIEPKENAKGDFLLLYDLIPSPETVALAGRWASESNLKVVRIGDGAYGPGEFLWLFAHACAVVTNSFHGTAFSIINHKAFYSVIPKRMGNADRIESLIAKLGLHDRLVRAADCEKRRLSEMADWSHVDARLTALRKESLDFLLRSIRGEAKRRERKLPVRCLAAQNTLDIQRAQSTSGGIFRLLAEYVIAKGGIVFGAAFDEDFRHVRHRSAETVDTIDPLMRSKYVWSDPVNAYKEVCSLLKRGRMVLFVGTPCQIAAVKKLAKDFAENLLTVDIVCHGTPRADMFASYVAELEERFGGKCMRYHFRDKRMGWNFPRVNAEFSGGIYTKILRNDPWYLGFVVNATLREGCFSCPYTNLERIADFTIADCWRIAASHPEWDDNKGTSLVLVNTAKAIAVWNDVAATGKVAFADYDIDLAQMRNMPLMQRARKPAMYDAVQRAFEESSSFSVAAKCFMSRRLALKALVVFWVKRLGWSYFRKKQ